MQPTYEPRSARSVGVSASSATMSLIPSRPPGRSTRAISRKTAGLSAARLTTQLLITTSIESAGSGIGLDVALEELDVGGAGLGRVALREREHLVGHVEAERAPGRPDALGRQEDVDPAAGAQVEDALAGTQVGDGGRVAAAERREDRGVGQLVPLEGAVQLGTDRLRVAAAGRSLVEAVSAAAA